MERLHEHNFGHSAGLPYLLHPSNALTRKDYFGGCGGARTPDPLLAKQVLSQLSYTPTVRQVPILKHFPGAPKSIP
jgi:hypothetical protein